MSEASQDFWIYFMIGALFAQIICTFLWLWRRP